MAILQGVGVTGSIVPKDSLDTYPTHESAYGKGSHRSVANITERNDITEDRREWGMLVTVWDDADPANNVIYELKYGETSTTITDNGNWVILNVGASSQTLAQTLDTGNTSGANDIEFDASQGILFNNSSRLREGTIDAGLGGNKGIAQICGVGYELKWEAGRLYIMNDNGNGIRQSLYNLSTPPTITDDSTKGYVNGSLWTLDNGDTYECTNASAGTWVNVGVGVGIVETTVNALQTLETNGKLSLKTLYIITDSIASPYKLMCKAETASQLSRTAQIVDSQYAGTVNYDIQSDQCSSLMISDNFGNPNYYIGTLPSLWTMTGGNGNIFYYQSTGTLGVSCDNNIFYQLSTNNTLGNSCDFNVFEQDTKNNILGANSVRNTFKQGVTGLLFRQDLRNVTIETGTLSGDYRPGPSFNFLYNRNLPSTIFSDGVTNYHRYFDPVNNRIVVTNLSTEVETYIGGTVASMLTGSGTANQLAYFTGTNTLGSLNTSSYPSLTELAYVKGLSSALQTQLNSKVPSSLIGVPSGIAELDGTGRVPSSQLPSYVDDVLEYADILSFPVTGESGKIYVAIDTNLTYRWSGTGYVTISPSLALGETSSTAYRGDRGKTAYDHSQIISGNPHGTTKADLGLGNVDNTSDIDKPISSATQTALNAKENTIASGTVSQYWRGDKSWQTLDKNAVGLGNVDNTSDANKPISTATQTALNGKANIVVITHTALATLETTGALDTTTLYLVSNSLPFKLLCTAFSTTVLNKTAILVDDTYTGSVNYNVQANTTKPLYISGGGNEFFGISPSDWVIGTGSIKNKFHSGSVSGILGTGCSLNIFQIDAYENELGNSSSRNTFQQLAFSNTLGIGCIDNYFGSKTNNNVLLNSCAANVFETAANSNSLQNSCSSNIFRIGSESNLLGADCSFNTFEQGSGFNAIGENCSYNTFGKGVTGFTFGDSLKNVTIEEGCIGADYTASPDYNFLYANSYPATIFYDGSDNIYRYYDYANSQVVLKNLNTLDERRIKNNIVVTDTLTLQGLVSVSALQVDCLYYVTDATPKVLCSARNSANLSATAQIVDDTLFGVAGFDIATGTVHILIAEDSFGNKPNVFYTELNNWIIGVSSVTNIFGKESSGELGANCLNNVLGDFTVDNILGEGSSNNVIESSENTLAPACTGNIFRKTAGVNTLGESCTDNYFGANCSGNNLSNYCSNNIFENSSFNNILLAGANGNSFNHAFSNTVEGGGGNVFDLGAAGNSVKGAYCYFGPHSQDNTVALSCLSIIFESNCDENILGQYCNSVVFKPYTSGFTFASYLKFVTIESGTPGADYSNVPTYGFMYNKNYPATIFYDGTNNYHRYYDPANNRIVLTNLTTLVVSYIGGAGGVYIKDANNNVFYSGVETTTTLVGVCTNNTFHQGATGNSLTLDGYNNTFYQLAQDNIIGDTCGGNVFEIGASNNDVRDGSSNNTFKQGASNYLLNTNCINNVFGAGSSGFIFAGGLQNVTVEPGVVGADYSNLTNYSFLYGKSYPATIFTDGTNNYHRYYDVVNDQIVITLLASPFTVSYIGGGGATPDLQQVTNVGNTTTQEIISDDGAGSFTIINNGRIDIVSGNTGAVKINASQVTANYFAQLPDKPSGTETFAMLSDLTGLGGGGLLSGTATQVLAGTYTTTIPGAGTYTTGDTYIIKFTSANDGASTININSQGAIEICKHTSIPLSSGDIKANQTTIIVYDGTNFQAIGLSPNQLFAYVHNAQGSTITKGQVVYAFGASGNKMSVKLARADADATSAKTIGMVFDTSIAAGGNGFIIIQGVIEGVNTGAFTAGNTLYLSGTTAGNVTATPTYAPTHRVYVGVVERANAGNGQIYVRCQNGYELDEIHDVSAQNPNNGDLLKYNSATSLWESTEDLSIAYALIFG